MEFEILPYFLESNIPLSGPFCLKNNNDEFFQDALKKDLNNINLNNLKNYYNNYKDKLDFLINDKNDKIKELKYWFICSELKSRILLERKNALINSKPYESDNLKTLEVNYDNLVSLDKFEICKSFLSYNNTNYIICLHDGLNSNMDFMNEVFNINKLNNVSFKIRLDPFIKNSNYYIEKYKVYGEPLRWKKLCNIREMKPQCFKNDSNSGDWNRTEIVWEKREDNLHFKCEELPFYENIEFKNSKFFHAIYNCNKDKIIHCDGAIKFYEKDEFKKRLRVHIKDKNSKNISKIYIKIFQGDGKISTDSFTSLITSFFKSNYDIVSYMDELNSIE